MTEDPRFVRTEPPKSPLDPYLCQFLRSIERGGYLPASDRHAITAALGWQVDFADAILTSAQARGMVERVPLGKGRRRLVWRVSIRGRNWLEMGGLETPIAIEADRDLSAAPPMM